MTKPSEPLVTTAIPTTPAPLISYMNFIPVEDYVRNAIVDRVVDGDTIVFNIDLGFSLVATKMIRLLGVNCPETKGVTREEGLKATAATTQWLAERGNKVTIRTHIDKSDSFGRILAEVWSNQESLAAFLLKNKLAQVYTKYKT